METFKINNAEPIDSREELIDISVEYCHRLIGADLADKLGKELTETPVILTGNHHCPDHVAFPIQGSILFGLSKRNARVVPIFACGGVPLDNDFYPRGIETSQGIRINIFPEKDKRKVVSSTHPFTGHMVENGIKQLARLHNEGKIHSKEARTLMEILKENYLLQEVLQQPNYSYQATLLNRTLWKKLYASDIQDEIPELVFLELEKIADELLENDLLKKRNFSL